MVTSIPYGLTKAAVVEKIAEVIIDKKLPMLVDVRDESTDDVRIVLELKKGADPALVMAYLYKHTPLESGVPGQPDLPRADGEPRRSPARCASIWRRCCATSSTSARTPSAAGSSSSSPSSSARIHILEGFANIFDALDEAIRIIRKSDGKADAAGS